MSVRRALDFTASSPAMVNELEELRRSNDWLLASVQKARMAHAPHAPLGHAPVDHRYAPHYAPVDHRYVPAYAPVPPVPTVVRAPRAVARTPVSPVSGYAAAAGAAPPSLEEAVYTSTMALQRAHSERVRRLRVAEGEILARCEDEAARRARSDAALTFARRPVPRGIRPLASGDPSEFLFRSSHRPRLPAVS